MKTHIEHNCKRLREEGNMELTWKKRASAERGDGVTLENDWRRIQERSKLNLQSGYFGHLVCRVSGRKVKSEEVAMAKKGSKTLGARREHSFLFAINFPFFFFSFSIFFNFLSNSWELHGVCISFSFYFSFSPQIKVSFFNSFGIQIVFI